MVATVAPRITLAPTEPSRSVCWWEGTQPASVLVVERPSSPEVAWARVLADAGFTVRQEAVLEAALEAARAPSSSLDCLVVAQAVGVDLQGLGPGVAAGLRPRVLVVVDRALSPDRMDVFVAEVDDVVVSPVSVREMVARVENLTAVPVTVSRSRVQRGCLVIDRDRREVRVDGVEVALPRLRYELLVTLAEAEGRLVPTQALLDRCWDAHQDVDPGTLRSQITRLRQDLGGRCEIVWVPGAGAGWVSGTGVGAGYVLRCAL